MPQKVHLLVIDGQVDFCTPTKQGGKLYVPGAEDDMNRLAEMVKRLDGRLDDIHITMDSHHWLHVAHPVWWKDAKGQHPDPFTQITVKDVESGRWTTEKPSFFRRSLDYVKSLEKNGRYTLTIWAPHCLIGTIGHTIQQPFQEALLRWEDRNFGVVNKVTKGSNIFTEHYSAVQADVPQADDPSTQINTRFIQMLEEADIIAFAGEAATHCVLNTVQDIINNFSDPAYVQKLVLLSDAMSCIPIPECVKKYEDFKTEMTRRGMKVSTTKEFLS